MTRVRPGPTRTAARGHEVIGHTADARIRAWAPNLATLYEEAAAALAGLMSAAAPGIAATAWLEVDVAADDLERLAYAWLNELIGLAEVERGGIVATDVVELHGGAGTTTAPPWRLHGRVGLHPFDGSRVHALRQIKAATLHGLRVESGAEGWSLDAVLDM